MINPAGNECRFYYEDFHRGHSEQTCRLVQGSLRSLAWRPGDCQGCPVPDIVKANGSPDLVLEGTLKSGLLGFNRRMEVRAFCSRHSIDVPEPHVGCAECARERPGLHQLFGDGEA